MPRTVSLGVMIQQLDALVGTHDVSVWEEKFIASVSGYADARRNRKILSDKQIEIVEQIYRQHFA